MQEETTSAGRPARETIEQELMRLVGVEAVRVCLDGDTIAEVHVAASAGSRPKNIVRDIRSYLAAALGIELDHKKISIAVLKPRVPASAGESAGAVEENRRVRFQSVQMLIEGVQAEALVRLSVDGRALTGSACGVPAAMESERLVACATLDALRPLLPDDTRFVCAGVAETQIGCGRAMLVDVRCVRSRSELRLIGACAAQADPLRGAVFATLDALNRVLGLLAPLRWTEVRVDPETADREEEA